MKKHKVYRAKEGWSALNDLLVALRHMMSHISQEEIEELREIAKNSPTEVSQRKFHPVAVPAYFFPELPEERPQRQKRKKSRRRWNWRRK
jgi:hypothetical protein